MSTYAWACPFLVVGTCLTARAAAQAPIPVIEPRYTRIFGSDTLRIGATALSPDGRWLVFNAPVGPGKYNLWIVPGTGGAARQLTSGPYSDWHPRWFPAGDRLAFTSDRSGHLMVLAIAPATGEPVGVPRQVTLRPARNFAISPDGQRIAYVAEPDSGLGRELRIVPAAGGAERVIHTWRPGMFGTRVNGWSSDGRRVVLLSHDGRRRWLVALPVAGGRPDTLYAGFAPLPLSFGTEYLLHRVGEQIQVAGGQPTYQLVRVGAGPLAQIRLPRGMEAVGFTPDGRGLLAVASDVVTAISVVPVQGGAFRQLVEGRGYDWPLGWSQDSKAVVIQTPLNGTQAVMLAPVDRTEMRQITLLDTPDPRFPTQVLPDGDRLLYAVQPPGAHTFTLKVFDWRDGTTRVVTRSLPLRSIPGAYSNFLSGPRDGSLADGNDVLYFEERRGRTALYRMPPGGPARLVYAFPTAQLPLAVAVSGDRVAFARPGGARSELFIAHSGQPPKRILTVDRWADLPIWSPDGRRLLFARRAEWDRADVGDTDLLVLELSATGDSVVSTRTLDAGAKWWWDVQWLPGDKGIVYLGMGGEGEDDTDVWMLSFEPDQRAVSLTRDDPRQFWGVQLSPDGRYVAYAPEIWRGSSVWRVDLSEVLAAGARR